MNERLNVLRPELERYLGLVKKIKDKTKQRNLLLDEHEEELRSVRERLRNHQQEQPAPHNKDKDRNR